MDHNEKIEETSSADQVRADTGRPEFAYLDRSTPKGPSPDYDGVPEVGEDVIYLADGHRFYATVIEVESVRAKVRSHTEPFREPFYLGFIDIYRNNRGGRTKCFRVLNDLIDAAAKELRAMAVEPRNIKATDFSSLFKPKEPQ